MPTNARNIILLLFIVLSSIITLNLCGNNPSHQRFATDAATMHDCLTCHDDITAKTVTNCIGKECLLSKSHSILRPYPPAGKERDYASLSEIEQAGCILEQGKTTCLSCHNLTKPPPHTIREGEQLCLICHISKKPQR